jgi:hypothetical protein
MRRLWDGLSAWDREDIARATALAFPRTGGFIVALDVAEGGLIRVEKTRGPGHYTVWGEPPNLLDCMVAVTVA